MIMRKKIICFLLTLTIVMLTACGNTDAENKTKYIQDYNSEYVISIALSKLLSFTFTIGMS